MSCSEGLRSVSGAILVDQFRVIVGKHLFLRYHFFLRLPVLFLYAGVMMGKARIWYTYKILALPQCNSRNRMMLDTSAVVSES